MPPRKDPLAVHSPGSWWIHSPLQFATLWEWLAIPRCNLQLSPWFQDGKFQHSFQSLRGKRFVMINRSWKFLLIHEHENKMAKHTSQANRLYQLPVHPQQCRGKHGKKKGPLRLTPNLLEPPPFFPQAPSVKAFNTQSVREEPDESS